MKCWEEATQTEGFLGLKIEWIEAAGNQLICNKNRLEWRILSELKNIPMRLNRKRGIYVEFRAQEVLLSYSRAPLKKLVEFSSVILHYNGVILQHNVVILHNNGVILHHVYWFNPAQFIMASFGVLEFIPFPMTTCWRQFVQIAMLPMKKSIACSFVDVREMFLSRQHKIIASPLGVVKNQIRGWTKENQYNTEHTLIGKQKTQRLRERKISLSTENKRNKGEKKDVQGGFEANKRVFMRTEESQSGTKRIIWVFLSIFLRQHWISQRVQLGFMNRIDNFQQNPFFFSHKPCIYRIYATQSREPVILLFYFENYQSTRKIVKIGLGPIRYKKDKTILKTYGYSGKCNNGCGKKYVIICIWEVRVFLSHSLQWYSAKVKFLKIIYATLTAVLHVPIKGKKTTMTQIKCEFLQRKNIIFEKWGVMVCKPSCYVFLFVKQFRHKNQCNNPYQDESMYWPMCSRRISGKGFATSSNKLIPTIHLDIVNFLFLYYKSLIFLFFSPYQDQSMITR
ncbi:hypothetical protein VP01_574g1 [Puccinia sorghi]|uniref:Uncharacterized protein n=1 Tax=Puccinia sorghi TaxID=27349 RepID=A0A0L6UIF7_9BASI|nr:hypothetical protein VP01_574g1 [Puccinia sorghi]